MWYSPISSKIKTETLTTRAEDKESYKNVAAFWAVMFCTGDTTEMVNMMPLMEEYRYNNAVPIHYGPMGFQQKLQFRLPFMTNKEDLNVGDLLVMPFDGGLPEIVCERFPPLNTPAEPDEWTAKEEALHLVT